MGVIFKFQINIASPIFESGAHGCIHHISLVRIRDTFVIVRTLVSAIRGMALKSEYQEKQKVLAKGYKQGSANRTDFRRVYPVFHADDHGVVYFAKMTTNYCTFSGIMHFRVDIFEGFVNIS